ncbi:hypothetical protein B296_00053215, partial [Ensete ventricosum]
MQGQLATAWPPTRGRPMTPEGAATHRGDACGHKCCLQGLPPTTNRGSARPQASPQRGDARGGAARWSGAGRRGDCSL